MARSLTEVKLINSRLMRIYFDWWRWLVITAFACLVLSFFCRCTTTRYVPMVQYKEKLVSKTDSFLRMDSVWLHDSVFVLQKGDTVLTDRWHYRDRYRYIYKNRTDTLLVHDSIPYKVVIEKPPSGMQKLYVYVGKAAVYIFAILGLIIAILARKIRKSYTKQTINIF